jgi:hypothetical protein
MGINTIMEKSIAYLSGFAKADLDEWIGIYNGFSYYVNMTICKDNTIEELKRKRDSIVSFRDTLLLLVENGLIEIKHEVLKNSHDTKILVGKDEVKRMCSLAVKTVNIGFVGNFEKEEEKDFNVYFNKVVDLIDSRIKKLEGRVMDNIEFIAFKYNDRKRYIEKEDYLKIPKELLNDISRYIEDDNNNIDCTEPVHSDYNIEEKIAVYNSTEPQSYGGETQYVLKIRSLQNTLGEHLWFFYREPRSVYSYTKKIWYGVTKQKVEEFFSNPLTKKEKKCVETYKSFITKDIVEKYNNHYVTLCDIPCKSNLVNNKPLFREYIETLEDNIVDTLAYVLHSLLIQDESKKNIHIRYFDEKSSNSTILPNRSFYIKLCRFSDEEEEFDKFLYNKSEREREFLNIIKIYKKNIKRAKKLYKKVFLEKY